MNIDNLLIKMIKRIPLFSGIKDEDAIEFASYFKLNFYLPNTTIIRQGEYPKHIYIVKNGNLSVERANALKNIKLAILGPGDIFGEMSYFTGDPAMASVITNTEVDLWEIPRDVFAKFLERYPYIHKQAWAVYEQRKKENEEKLKGNKKVNTDEDLSIIL